MSLLSPFFRRPACQAILAFSFAALMAAPIAQAAAPELKLKEGDVWVFAGDSITAQRQHTSYIEAYYHTRFPQLHLHFRNSGVGGNRTGNVLKRFDYDVAAFKPTVVSVELGMNDVNGPEEAYVKGLQEIIAKIKAIPAQVVLISSSPVDDGSKMNDWRSPRCEKLHAYTLAMQKVAAEENVVFVDQYHPLIDLWGDNRRKGAEIAAKNPAPAATPTPATPVPAAPGATPAAPKPPAIPAAEFPLGGDSVHVGPAGQYMMAATILKALNAPGEVSSATLSANGKVIEANRCKITDVTAKDGALSFTRLDEVSPWPFLAIARNAFKLSPEVLKMSQYLLKVTGLSDAGNYQVSINGKPAATVTGKELAAGWNITSAFEGALGERTKAIFGPIQTLQSKLNTEWRKASEMKDAEKLASTEKEMASAEEEIQKASQPAPFKFEIAPAK